MPLMYRSHFSATPGVSRCARVSGDGVDRIVAHIGRIDQRRHAPDGRTVPRPLCQGRGAQRRPPRVDRRTAAARSIEVSAVDLLAERIRQCAEEGDLGPDTAQFNALCRRDAGPWWCRSAAQRGILYQRGGQLGHAVVVGVRLVGLDRGELRRVRRVDTLVAEVAIDLEDPVDAADQRTLQEQFRRDAQEYVHVHARSGASRMAAPRHRRAAPAASAFRSPGNPARTVSRATNA